MNQRVSSTRRLCRAGVIAALYVALTMLFQPISFGAVQFRISEALCILPVLWPEAVAGLTVGCLISNLLGGALPPDVIFGTLATLLAAFATAKLRKNIWLAAFMPVVFNGVIVGLVLTYAYQIPALLLNMLTVALGEAAVLYILGIPLAKVLQKLPAAG
jgi:uncharacterized membrane protein